MSTPELVGFAGPDALVADVVRRILGLVAERGTLSVAVTGGSMGEALASGLEDAWPEEGAPPGTLRLWFSDERFVPADSPDRLDRHFRPLAGRPGIVFHPAPADEGQGPAAAAQAYEGELAAAPAMDVVVLGLGPDGHVASLFPGRPEVRDPHVGILPVDDSPKPPPQRVTFTLPLINAAPDVWLLVAGAGKAEPVATLWDGEEWRGSDALPGALVRGGHETLWFVDAAARGQG